MLRLETLEAVAGLGVLAAGVWIQYGLGWALIVTGAVVFGAAAWPRRWPWGS